MTYSTYNAGAEWTIYPRRQAATVLDYLRRRCPADSDPMCTRSLFITKDLENQISEATGVRPFVFIQRVGEAVFIPAGCPHQVSCLDMACLPVPAAHLIACQVHNLGSSIKIATDFCTIACLPATLAFAQDRRRWQFDDFLRIDATIWHAWESLINLSEDLRTQPRSIEYTKEDKKLSKRLRRVQNRHAKAEVRGRAPRREYTCPAESCTKLKETGTLFCSRGMVAHLYVSLRASLISSLINIPSQKIHGITVPEKDLSKDAANMRAVFLSLTGAAVREHAV